MNTTVQKWGNSLALRIPSAMAKDVRLRPGAAVELSVSDGKLVIKPKARRKYALSQLLAGVTRGNLHAEDDWGAAGREVL